MVYCITIYAENILYCIISEDAMLQIHEIRKEYITGDLVQTALDGVSLTLRDNEFVAILGPSGSGKTTLLNVIGGLDRYDSGNLIINGISTQKYSDRDWDSYRNHTIGFVFQSYNLIPHQTVLANVELALTISGISRAERKKRAIKALEDVGLGNQLHKRPNQMSGGQMQRVAIARALVNNPDILLADEPTGALDSETSIQVMELLKEVSKDRLVVMVTHNPELAEDYANRIVRLRDGKIIDDTNPYFAEVEDTEPPRHKNMGHSSMSFLTALSLSFNNLRTKKGRTILTSFAGSIGIIGIALIMSLSTGFQAYIDQIQEDTLSNYPLTIQTETADMTSVLSAYGTMLSSGDSVEEGNVLEQQMISQMFAQVGTNDLESFKVYLEENISKVEKDLNDIKYSYGVKPLLYSADTSDGPLQVNPGVLFGELTGMETMSAYMDSDIFYQMINNVDLLDSQYDVLRGRWPEEADEMVVVLSSPNQITDYMAYTLGLKETNGLMAMMEKVMNGEEAELTDDPMQWSYDDLMALEFRLVRQSDLYRYNEEYNVWEDMRDSKVFVKNLVENGLPVKVVGIACPKEGVNTTVLSPGVAYTSELTQLVIDEAAQSDIVVSQLNDSQINVFTGKPFGTEQEEKNGLNFEEMVTVDEEAIASAFDMNVDQYAIISMVKSYMESAYSSLEIDTSPARSDFLIVLKKLATGMLNDYIAANADPDSGEATLHLSDAETIVDNFLKSDAAVEKINELEWRYDISPDTLAQVYDPLLTGLIATYVAAEAVVGEIPELPEITLPDIDVPEVSPEEIEPTEEETIPEETSKSEVIIDPTLPAEDNAEAGADSQRTAGMSRGGRIVLLTDAEKSTASKHLDPEEIVAAIHATISSDDVNRIVSNYLDIEAISQTADAMSVVMMQAEIQSVLMDKMAGVIPVIMSYIGNAVKVNEEVLASAFQFNMDEEELQRLMNALAGPEKENSYTSNLRSLGYADAAKPNSISLYFVDFEAKSNFLAFLDNYNKEMEEAGLEDCVIRYTDITNIMMSSVRTIIDSVSYVLIAFVAVSLVVSSIMIGIITYISVMERTKEIGVLRAIGASKRNISQVFNAETFIIGLCSGLIGVGLTLLLNIPINYIIHDLTDNLAINAQLPAVSGAILVVLSMILTLIGGLIPSSHAAKKDPVIALRSE